VLKLQNRGWHVNVWICLNLWKLEAKSCLRQLENSLQRESFPCHTSTSIICASFLQPYDQLAATLVPMAVVASSIPASPRPSYPAVLGDNVNRLRQNADQERRSMSQKSIMWQPQTLHNRVFFSKIHPFLLKGSIVSAREA